MSAFPWLTPLYELVNQRFIDASWPSGYLLPLSGDLGGLEIAGTIVRRLLCVNSSDASCRTCKHCRLILEDEHPDLITIRPDSEASLPSIKIDYLRVAIERISKAPTLSYNQVIYIQSCELMTTQCANALLKTLEEPKSNLYLVLQANNTQKLLPTVRSRLFIETVNLHPEMIASYADQCLAEYPQYDFLRHTHKQMPASFRTLVSDTGLPKLYQLSLSILLTSTWQPLTQLSQIADYSVDELMDAFLFCLLAIFYRQQGLIQHSALSRAILKHAPCDNDYHPSLIEISSIIDLCLDIKRKLSSRISLNPNHLKSSLMIKIWRLRQ